MQKWGKTDFTSSVKSPILTIALLVSDSSSVGHLMAFILYAISLAIFAAQIYNDYFQAQFNI